MADSKDAVNTISVETPGSNAVNAYDHANNDHSDMQRLGKKQEYKRTCMFSSPLAYAIHPLTIEPSDT